MKEKLKGQIWTLVIHGGAGNIVREKFSRDDILEYESVLKEALGAGARLLEKGGTSLEAVIQAVTVLEDSPLFNAGKGAVFNAEGTNELDACLMDGENLRVGGVTGSTKIKNPIGAAQAVLEHSPHCLLAGRGADQFAEERGLPLVEQEYFFTQRRWEEWRKLPAPQVHGTVGAVALDQRGHLAAGTSTGGITQKYPGRVSDSAMVGAGNFADDRTCAISTTGTGDYFIRLVTAMEVSRMMEYLQWDLEQAGTVALQKVKDLGGEGGMIGVDREGNWIMLKNTKGMFRGMINHKGDLEVELF